MLADFIQGDTTLGSLVGAHPALIPWCAEKRLDFCCGGGKTLSAISQEMHLDLDSLIQTIKTKIEHEHVKPIPDWEDSQILELIDYILDRFHQGHRNAFPGLQALMVKVLNAHGTRLPVLAEIGHTLDTLISDLEPHMQKEENVLFPITRMIVEGQVPAGGFNPSMPIHCMRHEHDDAGHLLEKLTALTSNYQAPEGACRSFRGLYQGLAELDHEIRLHIHLENNVLFPMIEGSYQNLLNE